LLTYCIPVGTVTVGWMLISRTSGAKIAEIDARIDDLQVIRASLVSAIEVGCDDLMVCATTRDCPLPFTEIARVSAAS
jgi:hypothetical protein